MISVLEYSNNTIQPTIKKIFGIDGYLHNELKLEYRPEQEDMACTIADAFKKHASLLFEAGTGVGKSLAYLVPGIIHAIENERKLVVSTHTIALQEQILHKDLLLIRNLFSEIPNLQKYLDFKAALLVGRRNYLCPNRLSQAIIHHTELFPSEDFHHLQAILEWSHKTQTGLLEELNPAPKFEIWDLVNADSATCNSKTCNSSNCFYRKARTLVKDAHVVIVNHSLLFALLSAGMGPEEGRGVLFADDFLVLDEGHTIPDIATEHFGNHISSIGVSLLLKQLFNPRKSRGLLNKIASFEEKQLVANAIEACDAFFESVRYEYLNDREIVRLYKNNWVDPIYLKPLKDVIDMLAIASTREENETTKNELRDQRLRLLAYFNGLNHCLEFSNKEHVYWLERTGKKSISVNIKCAPIDVSKELREHLFLRDTAVVVTSATLSNGNNMECFQNKMGVQDALCRQVLSPFDYKKNMQVYIATDAPLPKSEGGQMDIEYLSDAIAFCTMQVEGGSLVLFTNYTDMAKIADRLEDHFAKSKRILLRQGRGASRTELIKSFKEAGNGILFGTDSFWTGIDVPGPSLSQIIITRLPFKNPNHPISEAKCEWIKSKNGNPFAQMTLPEALIQFRQGIGRLIRSKTDYGNITILDSRIFTKTYGGQFLAALPISTYHKFNKNNRNAIFKKLQHRLNIDSSE